MFKKKRVIILVLIIMVMCIIGGLITILKREPKEISNLKSFEYAYSAGMTVNGYSRYKVDCSDKCIAIIKPVNLAEEEAKEIKLSKKQISKLEKILKKYEVNKWDGFNKSDPNVLDGSSFGISIVMQNGDTISAHGYMKWPKNFSEVSKELDKMFEGLYNSK